MPWRCPVHPLFPARRKLLSRAHNGLAVSLLQLNDFLNQADELRKEKLAQHC
jgi:hypothetical protein